MCWGKGCVYYLASLYCRDGARRVFTNQAKEEGGGRGAGALVCCWRRRRSREAEAEQGAQARVVVVVAEVGVEEEMGGGDRRLVVLVLLLSWLGGRAGRQGADDVGVAVIVVAGGWGWRALLRNIHYWRREYL